MKFRHIIIPITFLFLIVLSFLSPCYAQTYPWLNQYDSAKSIAERIQSPDRYLRIKADSGSFAEWLRHLPLKDGRPPVLLYNGKKKGNQSAHYAVVDINVGNADLQQCADAVIRLRAEYFYSRHMYDSIRFNFTSGDEASFRQWIKGYRPVVKGNNVAWRKTGDIDSSYQNFKRYLNSVFMYAGSFSLSRELKSKRDVCDIAIGDVFIQGGFPGHVVIVVDVAEDVHTGDRLFLLAQGYTPAQDIHLLKNPTDTDLNPWYDCDFGTTLNTPEWVFKKRDLREW